ncbi:hypothetical protein [Cyclobacterium amurskyense]|uniref:hypothetical protein n=1 Tax=Cyclobacterium amurskyense TaxID=320787 RepID=UPI0030D7140D
MDGRRPVAISLPRPFRERTPHSTTELAEAPSRSPPVKNRAGYTSLVHSLHFGSSLKAKHLIDAGIFTENTACNNSIKSREMSI